MECETVENAAEVRRTRPKRDPAAVAVLPDDIVLWEIFVLLPAKELLRCRAACRSWRRHTSKAGFIVAHHRRQPSLTLSLFDTDAATDALDLRQSPAAVRRPVLEFSDYIECLRCSIHASVDGLLLLSLVAGDRFYICNPATRQWLALPALTGGRVAAMYPHRPSGEYRVLYRKNPKNDCYNVLTVGSSSQEGLRCIGLPVPSPSMKKLMTGAGLTSDPSPALLHDCLHWYSGSGSSSLDITRSKVVVFDTLGESFRCMRSPVAGNAAHLHQMDGTLTIHHLDYVTMMIVQVWELKDYKMEIWSLKCTIELQVVEMMRYGSQISLFGWGVVLENGNMLVYGHFPWCLLHFDSKGKLVGKFQQNGVIPAALGLCFKESLVRHVFFQRKDGKPAVWQPSFFRGP